MPESGLSQPGSHVTSDEAFAKSVYRNFNFRTNRNHNDSGISCNSMVSIDDGLDSERDMTAGLAASTLVPGPMNRKMACRMMKN